MRSNFSLRNSSTLSVFHLRMLSSSAMFPLSSKSFSTGSEPRTYYKREEYNFLLRSLFKLQPKSKPIQPSLTKCINNKLLNSFRDFIKNRGKNPHFTLKRNTCWYRDSFTWGLSLLLNITSVYCIHEENDN